MATNPTFIADINTLKAQLRLSGQPTEGDGEAQFNAGVLEVRQGFIRELGAARVAALVALPFTDNPVTADQATRALANLTELKWVRSVIIRTLPLLFLDASADQTQIYHDEATFRACSSAQLELERSLLESDVALNLKILAEIDEKLTIQIDTPVSDATSPLPGGTLFGGGQLGGHFI